MPDLIDFLPLRSETADTIRARIDADANAGVDPDSPQFLDLTPGGFYYDITQALVLEIERLWDFAANDVVAAQFVSTAWGPYLDIQGETVSLERIDAVVATGELTFSGADGIMIAIGTQVSTIQTDPEVDPVTFQTTEAGVIAGGTLTLAAEAVDPGTTGNAASGAASLLLTSVAGDPTVSNTNAFTGGTDVESDEAYQARLELEYSTPQGAGSVEDYERWALAYPGIGHVAVVPEWNGPGTVRVIATDTENNPISTTVRDAFQTKLDPFSAETTSTGSQTLPTGTLNVVSTAGFSASGRVVVNRTEVVTYTGLTGTSFTGCTGGTGSVPAATSVVQQGEGRGIAPIGAIATVDTPTTLTVTIAATVAYSDGYNADGTGGAVALQSDIEQALSDYIDAIAPGGDVDAPGDAGFVKLNKTLSRFFSVTGVYDITVLTINGSAADLAVGALQVPALGTVTLS